VAHVGPSGSDCPQFLPNMQSTPAVRTTPVPYTQGSLNICFGATVFRGKHICFRLASENIVVDMLSGAVCCHFTSLGRCHGPGSRVLNTLSVRKQEYGRGKWEFYVIKDPALCVWLGAVCAFEVLSR